MGVLLSPSMGAASSSSVIIELAQLRQLLQEVINVEILVLSGVSLLLPLIIDDVCDGVSLYYLLLTTLLELVPEEESTKKSLAMIILYYLGPTSHVILSPNM